MNQQNLPPGIIRDPYNYEIMAKVEAVERELQEQHGLNATGFQTLYAHIDQIARKDRRIPVKWQVVTMTNSVIGLVVEYDDYSQEVFNFILNVSGPIKFYDVKTSVKKNSDMFAIQIGNSGICITGLKKKVKEKYLYEQFIKAGIVFNAKFSPMQIGRALFESFSKEIKNTRDTLFVSDFGGWCGESYICKENFQFANETDFSDLPVMKKTIAVSEFNDDVVEAYCKEMKGIEEITDRILIAIYPFIGIIASLLQKAGIDYAFVINVIPLERIAVKRICQWFQVSEREWLAPVNANVTTNELVKICCSIRDESLLLDLRNFGGDTDYLKRKNDKNISKIIEAYLGNYEFGTRIQPMGLVTITDSLYSGRNVINILVGNDFISKDVIDDDVMTAIFYEFIKYIENNFLQISDIIKKHRNPGIKKTVAWTIAAEILQRFWESKGYNFWKIIGVKVLNDPFASIIQGKHFEVEDVISKFVEVVRKDASKYKFTLKAHSPLEKKEIYYDDNWMWIPKGIYDEICANNGLKKFKKLILLKCKESESLKTDLDGLTRKMTSGNVTKEFYQFTRGLFNKLGQSDVVMKGRS